MLKEVMIPPISSLFTCITVSAKGCPGPWPFPDMLTVLLPSFSDQKHPHVPFLPMCLDFHVVWAKEAVLQTSAQAEVGVRPTRSPTQALQMFPNPSAETYSFTRSEPRQMVSAFPARLN